MRRGRFCLLTFGLIALGPGFVSIPTLSGAVILFPALSLAVLARGSLPPKSATYLGQLSRFLRDHGCCWSCCRRGPATAAGHVRALPVPSARFLEGYWLNTRLNIARSLVSWSGMQMAVLLLSVTSIGRGVAWLSFMRPYRPDISGPAEEADGEEGLLDVRGRRVPAHYAGLRDFYLPARELDPFCAVVAALGAINLPIVLPCAVHKIAGREGKGGLCMYVHLLRPVD